MSTSAQKVVRRFWQSMATNDFSAASLCLTEDFRLQWPQSDEMIEGRENFAALNAAYPANGLWTFDLRRIVGEGSQIVTEVGVSDGVVRATALTFHTVRGDLIALQREFWPDPFEAPTWRSAWVRHPTD
ncbi:nuclear transport factor 2 family protein [Rhodobacteraceae bacterium N5(2021)]|uniref:Nuclear transport factor 2 family protein n=1 Tax=Gymnodinialimonas phycosphaerae TaxID=2841589 RepID=A0A975TVL2_9RHOB|nr:nuclear transport factor 2 family protein [Gymnodinialimonas phycosphaerae]MBY4894911.1 nuclear transport factor 2 family protein [Gymnodinialimonas phycosphaerae]